MEQEEQKSIFQNLLYGTREVGQGGREAQEEGNICIHILIVDSHCCMAETNTTL